MTLHLQFGRFLLVGGLATLLHYAILIALVRASAVDAVTASTVGFSVSAIANYAVNRRFTFGSEVAHSRAFPRFVTVALGGLAINAAAVWLIATIAGFHYMFAQVVATMTTLAWNFSCNRMWTFALPGAVRDSKETSR